MKTFSEEIRKFVLKNYYKYTDNDNERHSYGFV
jgi:hypothetical protein